MFVYLDVNESYLPKVWEFIQGIVSADRLRLLP